MLWHLNLIIKTHIYKKKTKDILMNSANPCQSGICKQMMSVKCYFKDLQQRPRIQHSFKKKTSLRTLILTSIKITQASLGVSTLLRVRLTSLPLFVTCHSHCQSKHETNQLFRLGLVNYISLLISLSFIFFYVCASVYLMIFFKKMWDL